MKEDFNECFKEQGGLLNTESTRTNNIINYANDIINHVRSIYSNLPSIYFNLINNYVLNANASLYNGNYFIGLNIGTVNLLEELFVKINSASSYDLTDYPKLNLVNTGNGLVYNRFFGIDILPLSEKGSNDSKEHFELVYRFVIYHEICHILRGHVAYLSSSYNLNIQEALTYESSDLISTLQTFEMDADSFATNRIINDFIENYIIIKNHDLTIYKDLKSFISNFAYSIYCFFRIFGFYTLEISKMKSKSHPSPSMRIAMIMSNISTILLEKKIQNTDEILEESIKSIKKAEIDIGKITFFDNQLDGFSAMYSNSELSAYIFEIVGNWKNIKPKLEKYSFSVLPD